MAAWSSDETLKFIDLYQNEPIIWNPRHQQHKNKNKSNDAWNRIADKLHVPVSELKKKKESLMATFRLHHRKKMQSIKSGMGEDELYNPIWPFYEPLYNFLKDVYECCSVINTEDNSSSSSTPSEQGTGRDMESNSPAAGTSINFEANNSRVPVVKRRSKNPPELAEVEKEMSNAFGTLNRVLHRSTEVGDDDCELYGKLLATRLRKFSESEREDIMLDIDQMLVSRRRNKQNTHTNSYIYTTRSLSSQSSCQSEWSHSSPSPHKRPLSPDAIPHQPLTQRVKIFSQEILPPQTIKLAPSHIQPESHVHVTIPEVSTQSISDHTYNSVRYQSPKFKNIIYEAYENA